MANDSTSPRTSAVQKLADCQNQQLGFSFRGLEMNPTLFVVLAVMLLGLQVGLWLLVVVAATYSQAADAPARSLDRGWALLSTLAMAWALANLYWSSLAGRTEDTESDTTNITARTAMLGHLAIAISCGLIAIGIHAISVAIAFSTDPIVMDYSHTGQHTDGPAQAETAVVAGDADEGRKVFSTTCITCHGPTGDGLPNLAPSLRGSPFIASADEAAIAGVIRLGRAVTDPANKTKKVMPARGGNPFLGNDKIAHLVAFVKAIQSESPGVTVGAAAPSAPPPVLLAKWVVPTAPAPPVGMISLDKLDDIGDDASLAARAQGRKSGLVKLFTLTLTGIHGLLLACVMVASSNVLFRELKAETSAYDGVWWSWSTLGWIAAAVVWFVVFVVGFVML